MNTESRHDKVAKVNNFKNFFGSQYCYEKTKGELFKKRKARNTFLTVLIDRI